LFKIIDSTDFSYITQTYY